MASPVDVFDHHPPTGAHGGDHAGQGLFAVGGVFQHGAGVGEVEQGVGKWVGQDVVLAHLEVGAAVAVQEARV